MTPNPAFKGLNRLADDQVYRSYHLALLVQVRDLLKELIKELIEVTEIEIEMSEEELNRAREEFGTTD